MSNLDDLRPMPGLEMIGRGIYMRPQQTYELKDVLFERANERVYQSKETGQGYRVPQGYEVNDSPPMPSAQALNQMLIEESWERFEKQTSLDIGLAVGSVPFSVDVNASQTGHLRVEDDAYYALRSSFIPLWTIYLPDASRFSDAVFDLDVPIPYDRGHRRTYERFFERFGTHYVKRVWVGGKATLAFTIAKSSRMTKDDIKSALQASQLGVGHVGSATEKHEAKERLQRNSECTVFGKGGDELKLAALSSQDEGQYAEWLSTIKENPQVIEFEVCGIWSLMHDADRAKALQQAYAEATVFTPVRVVFNLDRQLHVFRGDRHFSYHLDERETTRPAHIRDQWPSLSSVGFDQVDAAFLGKYLTSSHGEDLNRKLYFFNRDKYLRLDVDTRTIDPGYPKSIAEGWPGVAFDRIDAALNVAPDALYFFRGNQYVRFNQIKNCVDDGYPDMLSKRWAGVTFDRIDAAVYWGNGKVYFFRGNQHIRYDMVNYRADPGYPKFIIGDYVEDWTFIE